MKKRFWTVLLAVLCLRLWAGGVDGFEFLNRDINEILYTVSLYRGIAIVSDDTVSGKADFRFAGDDFESAFDSFLNANRLYVQKGSKQWLVSRVMFSDLGGGIIQLDASDIRPALLVEKINRHFMVEISFESLPEMKMSLHVTGKDAGDFAGAVVRQLGRDYSLEQKDSRLRIVKAVTERSGISSGREKAIVKKVMDDERNLYQVDVQDCQAASVLEELFKTEGREFVFACDSNARIKRILFSGKTFDETLSLLLSCASLKTVQLDGIIYVLNDTEIGNTPADTGKIWGRHGISYGQINGVLPVVENRFGKLNAVVLDGENSFLCFATPNTHQQIEEFLVALDGAKNVNVVTLHYIKTDDLLSHLPPGISSSQIKSGTQDNVFFFTGSREQLDYLNAQLVSLDAPARRLKYDLLVMQYQKTNDMSWDSSLSIRRITPGDFTDASVSLGSVLDLNLDVVGAFGFKFAASLQTAINENRASVFADTTLQGLSGSSIQFKSSNIYRYRDNNIDPETGKPVYTGVTREIASGLKIEVNGWVSGNGMITTKVTASVSRQGADTSSTTGNPPPTSEKVITTEVLCKSGEPIVLSGLVQNESSFIEQRTPGLGKIPGLGWAFKGRKETEEKTEMVIYLVPHWEKGGEEIQVAETDREFFERINRKYLNENGGNDADIQ
ncbi:MAG: hypothetical protein J6Y60_08330 [Treponema sp.]|nr:hypothetical protein [Treponema sp.]